MIPPNFLPAFFRKKLIEIFCRFVWLFQNKVLSLHCNSEIKQLLDMERQEKKFNNFIAVFDAYSPGPSMYEYYETAINEAVKKFREVYGNKCARSKADMRVLTCKKLPYARIYCGRVAISMEVYKKDIVRFLNLLVAMK